MLTFNYTQKLLAGVLALVLVAGMTSPAFAVTNCEITQNQSVNVDLAPGESLVIPKTFECNIEIIQFANSDLECNELGILVDVEPFNPTDPLVRDINEILINDALGTDAGHCSIVWIMALEDGTEFPLTQELWFNVPVAGELLPLDSSALMIAGLTSMSVWMIPTVLGLAGAGVYLVKYRANRD